MSFVPLKFPVSCARFAGNAIRFHLVIEFSISAGTAPIIDLDSFISVGITTKNSPLISGEDIQICCFSEWEPDLSNYKENLSVLVCLLTKSFTNTDFNTLRWTLVHEMLFGRLFVI